MEQVLPERCAWHIGPCPVHRPGVSRLTANLGVSIGARHSADGDLRGEFAGQDDEVALAHCESEARELTRDVDTSPRLRVWTCGIDQLCYRFVVFGRLQRRHVMETDDGEVLVQRLIFVLAVSPSPGDIHLGAI